MKPAKVAAKPPTGTRAAKSSPIRGPLSQVMVSMHGLDTSHLAARDEKYAAMRAQAKQARDSIVIWLKEQGATGSFKRVSQPTSFGTFTMECTSDVMRLLDRAPGVESVTRVSDVPMRLVSARR